MLMVIKRGDIFYADLRPVVGSEQGGIRPVIVLQNDAGNKYSPTIICAAITSKMNKAKLPTHVPIDCHRCELEKDSVLSVVFAEKQESDISKTGDRTDPDNR